MSTLELELYEALKNKIGQKESKLLIEVIENKVDKELEKAKEVLATKVDVAELKSELKEEISGVRNELKEEIAGVRSELKEEIAEVKGEITGMKGEIDGMKGEITKMKGEIAGVKSKISKSKLDLVRWMFAFWIGTVGTLLGVLKFIGTF